MHGSDGEAVQSRRFLLFDTAGLTAEQRLLLDQADGNACHRFYADLGDPATRDAEPVLLAATSCLNELVAEVWADSNRRWAASVYTTPLSLDELAQRLRRIRYVHTHDGQRYFFRFADSRCFAAMHGALDARNRTRLLGGWRAWQACARDGNPFALSGEPQAEAPLFALRLSADELDRLLQLLWPDQLLASALELLPALRVPQQAARQHRWMERLCHLFDQQGVHAYPQQLEAALRVLESAGRTLDDPSFAESLRQPAQPTA